jgi:hypothetical protein
MAEPSHTRCPRSPRLTVTASEILSPSFSVVNVETVLLLGSCRRRDLVCVVTDADDDGHRAWIFRHLASAKQFSTGAEPWKPSNKTARQERSRTGHVQRATKAEVVGPDLRGCYL